MVPVRRFPEFKDAGDWEEKTLDEIAVFFKGKGISKADIDPKGETPCIRYGELYTLYGEVISTVFSRTKLLTSELFLSQKNDVLIPSSGETKIDIAKASCVLLDDIALGGDLNVLRPNENGIFLSYMLNGVCKREIAKKAQGDTVVHLYSSQLKLLDVIVPKEPEKQKIADCLTSIDELITAQTQKLDALKIHKKGLMQQLFPAEGETVPKLRFPEFRDAGDWEEKQLKHACDMQAGKVVQASEIQDCSNDDLFPCYGGNGLRGYTKTYTHEGTYSLIGRQGALCGNVNLASGRFHATEHAVVTTPKAGVDINWLFYKLVLLNLNQYATGQAQPGLSVENLQRVEIKMPRELKEQKKIADCLSSVDELITAQTQKLDALKTHKKGLMQQLFPAMDDDCMDTEIEMGGA